MGLDEDPNAVRYSFFRPEDVPQVESDAAMSLCEYMRMSQKENRGFYFSKENTETCVGKIIMGMEEWDGFAASGNIGKCLGVFNEARCNSNYYLHVKRLLSGTTNYVTFCPLSQAEFDPDLIVVSATPAKAEIIMRAMTWSTGELYESKSSAVIGCSWILAYPHVTQKVNFVVPRLVHGPHGRELYPDDTILVSIPYRWIPAVLKGLKEMPIHLKGHESKEAYYSEFEGILKDLGEKAQNP